MRTISTISTRKKQNSGKYLYGLIVLVTSFSKIIAYKTIVSAAILVYHVKHLLRNLFVNKLVTHRHVTIDHTQLRK